MGYSTSGTFPFLRTLLENVDMHHEENTSQAEACRDKTIKMKNKDHCLLLVSTLLKAGGDATRVVTKNRFILHNQNINETKHN